MPTTHFKYLILTAYVLCLISLLGSNVSADQKNAVRVLNKHCSACHSVDRVFNIEKTSIGWAKTVAWMRDHSQSAFSEKQAKIITQDIIDLHPNYAKELFQNRCNQCHEWKNVAGLKLSLPQWHRLVYRERAKAITWISLDEAEDIAAYLAKTYPGKNLSPQAEADRDMVEQKCLRCHIHATVFKPVKTIDQWLVTNKRMQGKSPSLINDKDVLKISQYLKKVNPLPEWE